MEFHNFLIYSLERKGFGSKSVATYGYKLRVSKKRLGQEVFIGLTLIFTRKAILTECKPTYFYPIELNQ